jgi:hypothetical protein
MEWLLPNLSKATLLQPSKSSSSFAADIPPSLSMESEDEEIPTNKIITLESDDDEDDDGPPMLDRAVPVASQRTSSSQVINVPVSKEQFSIIEAHKSEEPKTLLEALQKFNQTRKPTTTTSSSSSPGSSKPLFDSNPSASLSRLLSSFYKKPVTPLAGTPSQKSKRSIPVISFKKPVSALKLSTHTLTLPSTYSQSVTPSTNLTFPTSSNATVSISIKETTNNPLLESIIASASRSKFSSSIDGDRPPTLTDFSNDVIMEKCEEEPSKKISELELPPNLEKINEEEESSEDDGEKPPTLECALEESKEMAVTRSQNSFSCSDNSFRHVQKQLIRKKQPKKQQKAFSKSENSPIIDVSICSYL